MDLPSLVKSADMEQVKRKNRSCLSAVGSWISDETYGSSVCGYGIMDSRRHFLDREIGAEPTYSDAMLCAAGSLKKQITYLELGVSVGKNFLQVLQYVNDAVLVGFDIERINPVLEKFLGNARCLDEWQTAAQSPKKSDSTLSEYRYAPGNNHIIYLCGDLRDESSWRRLSGLCFNMIFSDAVHSPDSVLHEFRMLEQFGLIDKEEFLLVWDDLAGPMAWAFDEIWASLDDGTAARHVIDLNGWMGSSEPAHSVGFITRFK